MTIWWDNFRPCRVIDEPYRRDRVPLSDQPSIEVLLPFISHEPSNASLVARVLNHIKDRYPAAWLEYCRRWVVFVILAEIAFGGNIPGKMHGVILKPLPRL